MGVGGGAPRDVGADFATPLGRVLGIIPWHYNFDRMQEEWFLRMAAPENGVRAISLPGVKILARRLRDAAAANHARRLASLAQDRRCPLDRHRLVPVPPAILQLGPEEPQSQAWLWSHWGTTRALRHVRSLLLQVDQRRVMPDQFRRECWSADWSPWQALRRLRRSWPQLRFALRPDYRDGAAHG